MKKNPFFKNRKEVLQFIIFMLLAVGVPMSLFFLGITKYSLRDQNDPIFLRVAGATFALALAAQIIWRKRIFRPWKSQPLFLWSVIVLGGAVCSVFAALGAFLIGNGILDSGTSRGEAFHVLAAYDPPNLLLQPAGGEGEGQLRFDAGRAYWQATSGSTLVLKVRPGFFGHPWVSDRTVNPSPGAAAARVPSERPATSHHSPVSFVMTAAIVLIVMLASRRSRRRKKRA